MNIFQLLTPAIYWLVIVMWAYILFFCLGRLRLKYVKSRLVSTLFVILAIDALRTLFENLYLGAWYTPIGGLLPTGINDFLVRPEIVIIPKSLNVMAAALVITILLRRWLPYEEQERIEQEKYVRELRENIEYRKKAQEVLRRGRDELEVRVKERTEELTISNEKLQAENTERKKAEEALRRAAQEWRTTFDSITDLVSIHDKDFKIVRANKSFADAFNMKPKEIIGKNCYDLMHGTKEPPSFCPHKQALETGKPHCTEVFEPHLGIYIQISVSPIFDENGRTIATAHIVRDITEREKAEEEKMTLEAQLRHTQKMQAVGILAGGIAHDFNNILTAMIGCADLALQDTPEGTAAQKNLQQVLMAGSRAKELIRQILTFSRKTEQEQEPMEIAPIVKETLKMLRASIPTTIEIKQSIEADSSVIMANPTEVQQVLVNLCTNAAHAMGEKGGVLEVSLMNVDIESVIITDFGILQEGSYLKLSVKDTGCGMDGEVMGRIFEPFFTTKDVGKGTGMGLPMVHGIVESYGGLITVDSEPGKGTTFNVFFPRIYGVDIPETKSLEVVCGRGELILLVDDEKPIVDMITQMLQRLGYVVVGETSSVDALETFRTQADKFDLVIADYAMPNITGKQLAKELMSIRPDIPIILCTGFNDDIDAEGAKSTGIKEFIMKPIDRKNIAVIIRNILDKKEIRV